METKLTNRDVHEHVMAMLGVSGTNIELTPGDIDKALRQAIRKYSRVKPRRMFANITVTEGTQRYPLPENVVHLVAVQPMITSPLPTAIGTEFDIFRYPYYELITRRGFGPFSTVGDIEMYQIYFDEIAKVLSAEFAWWERLEVINTTTGRPDPTGEERTVLYVYPPPAGTVSVEYRYLTAWNIYQFPEYDHDWLLDYTTAISKLILGEIRGKFSGQIPSATARLQIRSLDLIKEAQLELQRLDQDLRDRIPEIAPIVE